MTYMAVIARLFRCGVQINQETCLSSYVTSEKTGKHSSIAQFDETFLLQVYTVYGPVWHTNAPKQRCRWPNNGYHQHLCSKQEQQSISKPPSKARNLLGQRIDPYRTTSKVKDDRAICTQQQSQRRPKQWHPVTGCSWYICKPQNAKHAK